MVRTFKTNGGDANFTVQQTLQGAYDATYKTFEIIMHGLPFVPKECNIDGQVVHIEMLDKETNLIKIIADKNFQKLAIA